MKIALSFFNIGPFMVTRINIAFVFGVARYYSTSEFCGTVSVVDVEACVEVVADVDVVADVARLRLLSWCQMRMNGAADRSELWRVQLRIQASPSDQLLPQLHFGFWERSKSQQHLCAFGQRLFCEFALGIRSQAFCDKIVNFLAAVAGVDFNALVSVFK